MRYFNRFLLAIIFVAAGCEGALFASEFSRSVAFIRTQGRAAAVGSIDAVYYNPAGLAGIKDGLYIDAGYQMMTKTTAVEIWYMNHEDNTPSWFIPNFAMAYKKGKGAIFISLFMPEGIELIEYREPQTGLPVAGYLTLGLDPVQMGVLRSIGCTINTGSIELPYVQYIKGSKYWLQGRLGGAYTIADIVTFSGGIACNYFQADRSAGIINVGTIDKIERQALGWSGFAGLMVGKLDKFALAVLYETEVIARGTEKDVKYNYTHIIEQRYPDSLLIGFNLKSGDGASLQLSYQVAFTGERNYGTKNILTTSQEFGYIDWAQIAQNASAWAMLPLINNGNAQNYKYKNRHSFGFTMEFDTRGVTASAGISYTTQEKYPRAQNPLDPDLARVGIGAGVKINASNNVAVDTGTAYYFYITDRMLYNSIKMNKMSWTWGISTTFKAM